LISIIKTKKNQEKEILTLMISIYCRGNHNSNKNLCLKCDSLLKYAHSKSDICPFTDKKTFCSSCKIHCYSDEMRSNIIEVMRYSAPRMLFYHPIILIKHILD